MPDRLENRHNSESRMDMLGECWCMQVFTWKINFVEDGNDLQLILQCNVHVRQRLGFNTLHR